MRRVTQVCLLLILLLGLLPLTHAAVPPRLGELGGEVSFLRPGAGDWSAALRNTPLAAGDALYSAARSEFEIQLGARAFARGAENTQLTFGTLDERQLQLRVAGGRLALDLATLPARRVEVVTPAASVLIERAGYYRFEVDADGTRLITRRSGEADVVLANGRGLAVGSNALLDIAVDAEELPAPQYAPAADDWDRWNFERSATLLADSDPRLDDSLYGSGDLDRYGRWIDDVNYGEVWLPSGVGADWAPYSDGRWIYDPGYGWSWIDAAPWGWAPFHYGRWVRVGGDWGWAPGPRTRRPDYAPAVVGWLGPPGGAAVGWVALGWGEPLLPWWGPARGRPWWGGWGGPRHFDGERFDPRHPRYVHAERERAVVFAPRAGFVSGARDYRRLPPQQSGDWQPFARGIDARPLPGGYAGGASRGPRPPHDGRRPEGAARMPAAPVPWLPHREGAPRDIERTPQRLNPLPPMTPPRERFGTVPPRDQPRPSAREPAQPPARLNPLPPDYERRARDGWQGPGYVPPQGRSQRDDPHPRWPGGMPVAPRPAPRYEPAAPAPHGFPDAGRDRHQSERVPSQVQQREPPRPRAEPPRRETRIDPPGAPRPQELKPRVDRSILNGCGQGASCR